MTDVTLAEVLATAEQDGTAPRYQVPENWAQGRTAFGGFTGALLVNAARRDRPDLPALRSALINFTAPVSQPPTIHAEVLREGLRPFADVHNVTRLNEVHEALSAGPLDVIILDWTVPDGDAAAVLDDIAELQPTARVVGLTSDAAREKDSRVGTHLVKSQTDLNHIIESIVGPTQIASCSPYGCV